MLTHICRAPHTGPARPQPKKPSWREPGIEPRLADVMADPLVRLLMRRDGVTFVDMTLIIERARSRLRTDPPRSAARRQEGIAVADLLPPR
jgi:hypothetical protein